MPFLFDKCSVLMIDEGIQINGLLLCIVALIVTCPEECTKTTRFCRVFCGKTNLYLKLFLGLPRMVPGTSHRLVSLLC